MLHPQPKFNKYAKLTTFLTMLLFLGSVVLRNASPVLGTGLLQSATVACTFGPIKTDDDNGTRNLDVFFSHPVDAWEVHDENHLVQASDASINIGGADLENFEKGTYHFQFLDEGKRTDNLCPFSLTNAPTMRFTVNQNVVDAVQNWVTSVRITNTNDSTQNLMIEGFYDSLIQVDPAASTGPMDLQTRLVITYGLGVTGTVAMAPNSVITQVFTYATWTPGFASTTMCPRWIGEDYGPCQSKDVEIRQGPPIAQLVIEAPLKAQMGSQFDVLLRVRNPQGSPITYSLRLTPSVTETLELQPGSNWVQDTDGSWRPQEPPTLQPGQILQILLPFKGLKIATVVLNFCGEGEGAPQNCRTATVYITNVTPAPLRIYLPLINR